MSANLLLVLLLSSNSGDPCFNASLSVWAEGGPAAARMRELLEAKQEAADSVEHLLAQPEAYHIRSNLS